MTISSRVSTVSKTISMPISTIAISSIESISLRFSFSLTLGNMDNTSRVGNISASSSITTMDSRDSSRSNTMDSYSIGNIGDAIACMVDRGSIAKMSSIAKMASIAKMTNIAEMTTIAIGTIKGIGISSSKGCRANLKIKKYKPNVNAGPFLN